MNTADYWYDNGQFGPTNAGPTFTSITYSVWDGDWALLEEYDKTGAIIEKYVQGYHGLVKTLVANVYYYQDELGSTSHIANASGTLLEYYKYDLYGKPQFFSSTSQPLNSSTHGVVDLGNGGARWMPELGLYDNRNRFMSPDLGRFLQPDPIGFKGDASNLYRYCGNDWTNRTDPNGLDSVMVVYPDYWVDTGRGFKMQWGHAGLLTINNQNGTTKYYEYGRYNGDLQGHVVTSLPGNVGVKDGQVDRKSLTKVLQNLAANSGQQGRVEAAYVATNDKQQAKINAYAEARLAERDNPNRKPYSATGNSCIDFPRNAVQAAEDVKVPSKSSPYPNQEIQNLQRTFDRVSAPPPPKPSQQSPPPPPPPPQASDTEPAGGGGDAWLMAGLVLGGRGGPPTGGPP